MDKEDGNQVQKSVINGRGGFKNNVKDSDFSLTKYYSHVVLKGHAQCELSHSDCANTEILKSCFIIALGEQNLTRRAHHSVKSLGFEITGFH
jgi:hypothetical protein